MKKKTILFLCPHGGGKSAIAAKLFEAETAVSRLPYRVDFAGLDPYPAMPQSIRDFLNTEGHDGADHVPRHVTQADLDEAVHIVSVGCALDGFVVDEEKLLEWNDVPMLSDGFDTAVADLRARVNAFVETLR